MTRPHPATHDFDYAIVGMGIGGLTAGALLARAGYRVAIFEQHEVPGGYGHSFHWEGYTFCAELHYVWDCGPGERVTRVLEKLGLAEQVTFHRLNPDGFDRVMAPGIDYTIGSGFEREQARLGELFPEQRTSLRRYYELVSQIHRQLYDLPLGFNRWTFLRHPRRYDAVARYLRWTLQDVFEWLQFPVELRLILAGQSAIFWLPPRDLSFVVHAGGVASYDQGAYYPRQSFMHVMRALLRTIKSQPGCRGMLATEIRRIRVDGDRATAVVTTAGDEYTAGTILFNADAHLSLDLIGPEHFPPAFRRKLNYTYGTSVLSVYLGLSGIDLAGCGIGEANIFWHPAVDLNQVYDAQLGPGIPPRPFFFCNAPTQRPHEIRIAPPGCEQLVLVAPCNYSWFRELRQKSEQEYQSAKQTYADRLLEVVESELAPGLRARIDQRVVGSPLTNEYYVRAPQGNCYSTPLDPKHVNLRRLNYQSPFDNLFYVGASSSLPGFATQIHFATLLYQKLTGDTI